MKFEKYLIYDNDNIPEPLYRFLQQKVTKSYKKRNYQGESQDLQKQHMNSQHRLLLQSIEQNYNNQQFFPSTSPSQTLYVSPTGTHQELFLQRLINIYVLRKKEYNKINQERIAQLMKQTAGSFTDLLLSMRFMSYCMENKIEVSYEKFGMLKLLTGWMDVLEKIKKQPKVNLCRSVLGFIVPQNKVISKVQQLIVYLNYIAVDLQQIIERPSQTTQQNNQSASSIQQKNESQNPTINFTHLDPEDLIQFLNNILPKTLYNIVILQNLLINKPMTSMNPLDQRQHDFLFAQQSIQYFAKQKSHYQQLLKLLINTLLKFPQLQQPLQRQLMLCAMRYLYVFNRNKYAESFKLFCKVFEKLSEAVRFALSDEFVLFFKVIKKIGHYKFIDYLKQKYQFVEDLHQKLDINAVVGYPKDSLNAFHSFPIMESIFVNPGTMTQRFIEILEPYSLLYFYIGIKALDINVRFYYLGSFTSPTEKKQLLLNKEKCLVQFKGNIIALQKGIYMFEFDNTYSWMKGKSILYDTMVLTPLDLSKGDIEKEKFLNVLFNKFQMNSCMETGDVKNLGNMNVGQVASNNIEQKPIQDEKLRVDMQYDQESHTYNLKTEGDGKVYEYETDNQNLFKKKAGQIYQALKQSKGSGFEWFAGSGLLVSGMAMIEEWCNDPVGFVINEAKKMMGQSQPKVQTNILGSQKPEQEQKRIDDQQLQNQQAGQEKKVNISEDRMIEKQDKQEKQQKEQQTLISSPVEQYPSLISQTAGSILKTVQEPQQISLPNAIAKQQNEQTDKKEQQLQEIQVQQQPNEQNQQQEEIIEDQDRQDEDEDDDGEDL